MEKITVNCQCGGEKMTDVSVEGRRYNCQCGGEKINSRLSVWRGEDDRRCHDKVEKIPHVVC